MSRRRHNVQRGTDLSVSFNTTGASRTIPAGLLRRLHLFPPLFANCCGPRRVRAADWLPVTPLDGAFVSIYQIASYLLGLNASNNRRTVRCCPHTRFGHGEKCEGAHSSPPAMVTSRRCCLFRGPWNAGRGRNAEQRRNFCRVPLAMQRKASDWGGHCRGRQAEAETWPQ
jgi:hypothetical protein